MTLCRTTLIGVVAAGVAACGPRVEPIPADYHQQVEAFRDQRASEIIAPAGWAALVGLHWLTPGVHTIGSEVGSDVLLTGPSAPASLGTVTVTETGATLTVAEGVDVRRGEEWVTNVELLPGAPSDDYLVAGGVTLTLIERGERLALRVWDTQAPAMLAFTGLDWMPTDEAWRVQARFEAHTPEPQLKILNVLDEIVDMRNPGVATFTFGEQAYRLEALLETDDAEELFFMFRDATSGTTTYGAGRYLYTALPQDGRVILDFNQAKNPPCAFTDFATCPLPPKGNVLSLAVMAGELDHLHKRR